MYIFRRGQLDVPPPSLTVEDAVRMSDIVVLGVPSPSYKLDVSWIKEGAIVLNVASHKNIDEAELLSTRPGVRFVGQVGKVTVALLERNLLRLHENFALKAEGRRFSAIALGQPIVSDLDTKNVQSIAVEA